MTDPALRNLISRVASDATLPVELRAPVLADLHCVAANPTGSPLNGYGLDTAAQVISETWPMSSELGADVLAYVQARRRS